MCEQKYRGEEGGGGGGGAPLSTANWVASMPARVGLRTVALMPFAMVFAIKPRCGGSARFQITCAKCGTLRLA